MTSEAKMTFSVRIAQGHRVLADISQYSVPTPGIMFLFGESGIGKSLINRAVFGLLDREEFDVYVSADGGVTVPSFFEEGFFVFQEPSTHLYPLRTIGDQLREGSLSDAPDLHGVLRELWEGGEAGSLLQVYPKPFRPSGGEKQRVLLAMAMMKVDRFIARGGSSCPLFVFDEPTGSLDNRFRDIVMGMLIRRYRSQTFTAVVVSHDYSLISMLQRHYSDMAGAFAYRELVKEGEHLLLREFAPETYSHWLKEQQPPPAAEAGRRKIVARVESSVGIFGKTLTLRRSTPNGPECSLDLRGGVMTYVKAPSGMGKTTLLKMMMGLLRGEHFRMRVRDIEINERTPESLWRKDLWGRIMTMVFQHADEALNPQATVRETFDGLPLGRKASSAAVMEILQELFDPDVAASIVDRKVADVSGGQKQRLNLLRGLSLNTPLLILDEPLNGLDFAASVRVLAMLRRRLELGASILVVSHNEEIFDSQVAPEEVYYLTARKESAC